MHSTPDDALRWEGDEDAPVEKVPAEPAASAESSDEAVLPEGWHAVGKGSEKVSTGEAVVASDEAVATKDDSEAPAQASTAMLVTTGIVAGVYLLYTIGWIVGGLRLQGVATLLVSDYAYVPMFWVAVLAPALWFLAAWVLTRGRKSWVRVLALVAGIAVLVPWPFVMFGSLGGGL